MPERKRVRCSEVNDMLSKLLSVPKQKPIVKAEHIE